MRNSKLFLRDILDAMDAIERFVGDMDLGAFVKDDKTSSAVIRTFEIIGEAGVGGTSVPRPFLAGKQKSSRG